jgi:hypothetical protein
MLRNRGEIYNEYRGLGANLRGFNKFWNSSSTGKTMDWVHSAVDRWCARRGGTTPARSARALWGLRSSPALVGEDKDEERGAIEGLTGARPAAQRWRRAVAAQSQRESEGREERARERGGTMRGAPIGEAHLL